MVKAPTTAARIPTTLARPSGLLKRITSILHTTAIKKVKTGMAFCIAAANAVFVNARPARNNVCCRKMPVNPRTKMSKDVCRVIGVRLSFSVK
ncbi:hypothetical protein Mapa_012554 [Marchantia paleacea]|nr:hypothetical protein Mapa_012554 [Marchantia paleacea]